MRAPTLSKRAFLWGKQFASSQLLANVTKLFVQNEYIYIYIYIYNMLSYDVTEQMIGFKVNTI